MGASRIDEITDEQEAGLPSYIRPSLQVASLLALMVFADDIPICKRGGGLEVQVPYCSCP